MAKLQVLTYDNLEVIKNYIDVNDTKSLKAATIEGNVLKLYNVPEPIGATEPDCRSHPDAGVPAGDGQ